MNRYVSDTSDTLVTLAQISPLLNEFFDLSDDTTIKYSTPYVWWDRSKRNDDIALPMPKPVMQVGRSNAWRQDQILHWYGEWMDLDVPFCRAAGDKVNSRGHELKSQYRVREAR